MVTLLALSFMARLKLPRSRGHRLIPRARAAVADPTGFREAFGGLRPVGRICAPRTLRKSVTRMRQVGARNIAGLMSVDRLMDTRNPA
jgi:hypothetical protein